MINQISLIVQIERSKLPAKIVKYLAATTRVKLDVSIFGQGFQCDRRCVSNCGSETIVANILESIRTVIDI
jgi:hypothetical protein